MASISTVHPLLALISIFYCLCPLLHRGEPISSQTGCYHLLVLSCSALDGAGRRPFKSLW